MSVVSRSRPTSVCTAARSVATLASATRSRSASSARGPSTARSLVRLQRSAARGSSGPGQSSSQRRSCVCARPVTARYPSRARVFFEAGRGRLLPPRTTTSSPRTRISRSNAMLGSFYAPTNGGSNALVAEWESQGGKHADRREETGRLHERGRDRHGRGDGRRRRSFAHAPCDRNPFRHRPRSASLNRSKPETIEGETNMKTLNILAVIALAVTNGCATQSSATPPGAPAQPAGTCGLSVACATKPDVAKARDHLAKHVNYPATRAEILAA